VLVVSSFLATQAAFASARRDDGVLLNPFARVARVVVKILSEFGFPPG
jgi:hypothetical protein